MQKRTKVIATITVLLIAIGAALFTNTGKNFFGLLMRFPTQKTVQLDIQLDKVLEIPKYLTQDFANVIKTKDLTPPASIPIIELLTSQTFENVEVKSLWAPSKYREESDKTLIKLFPFPTVEFAEEKMFKNFDEKVFQDFDRWEYIGVKGIGVISSIDYSKQDYNKLLMASASGVYKSSDFGGNWTKIENLPNNHSVSKAIMDPNDDTHFMALSGVHLYESTDSGNSWQLNTTLDNFSAGITDLQWKNTNIFLNTGIASKISYDNGNTWESYTAPFSSWGKIKINNNGYGVAIAQSGIFETLYLTEDYGRTWSENLSTHDYGILSTVGISESGRIIAVFYNENSLTKLTFAKSNDHGNTWEFEESTETNTYWPQDISLDEENEDHFIIFMYMMSIHETFDGGQTLIADTDTILEYDVLNLQTSDTNYIVITPLDMRTDPIKKITVSQENFNPSDLNSQLINNVATAKAIGTSTNLYLIPSDQGLYVFNDSTRRLTNIAKDIYLAQTGKVSIVESCPRIYAGFWHVGHFYIDNDGSIYGFNSIEKVGGTPGNENGCDTPIMYSQGIYSTNGVDIDWNITEWIWNTLDIGGIGSLLFKSYGDWWFAISNQNLVKINVDTLQSQTIFTPDENQHLHAYYIDETQEPATFWLLIENTDTEMISIYNSTNTNSWSLYKNLTSLQTIIFEDYFPISATYTHTLQVKLLDQFRITEFKKDGNQIMISGVHGSAISNDDGDTWNQSFEHASTSNIVKDSQGRLFIGLNNVGFIEHLAENIIDSGVWYSTDHGNTWSLLETETDEALIAGLAIDNTRNILYASTEGESLIQFNLNFYNLPEPPRKVSDIIIPILPEESEYSIDINPSIPRAFPEINIQTEEIIIDFNKIR